MGGIYLLFMTVMIIGLAVGYAAQFRPPDHEAPSDVERARPRAEGDDAA